MCQAITSKFYPAAEQEQIVLPLKFSVGEFYDQDGDTLDHHPLLACFSSYLQNIIGNLHNSIMASDASSSSKLAKVALLSVFSTVGVTLLAVAETIVRFVPAVFAMIIIFTVGADNNTLLGRMNLILAMGELLCIANIFVGISSGYHMLAENKFYSSAEKLNESAEKLKLLQFAHYLFREGYITNVNL